MQWRAEATEADRLQALARIGGQQTRLIHTASMKAEGEGVLEVIQLPEGEPLEVGLALYNQLHLVRFAERDQILQPQAISNDPGYANGSLWGMYSADSPLSIGLPGTTSEFGSQSEMAWDAGFLGSKSVYVGVLDEGFDYTHPDLSANAWVNPYEVVDGIDNDGNGYIDDIRGWDFNSNDNTTFDGPEDDHGTHVAGTIGAVGGNGLGVAGVNWSVSMISVKFLGTNGGTLTGAIMAMDYLTDLKRRHGLNIVASNNSWGGLTSYSKALQDATVRAAKQDILFIAAAGNTGGNNDISTSYPSNTNTFAEAGYDSVVAVTSLTSTGDQAFSYGSSTVDLGAPGVGIYSTLPGGAYGTFSGTSMATPHVTGAVALYAAKYPNVSARQIREALLASTTPTASLEGKTVTGGRLDVNAFLNKVPPSEFSISASQAYLSEGQNGTTPFSFLISRKGSDSGPETVSWAVSGWGSTPADASDFADMHLPTGTVSFSPGEISKTLIIDVLADSLKESSEAFAVTLSSPTQGAALGTATASSIILNDDGVVTGLNSTWITIPPSGSANPSPSSIIIATESDVSLLSLDLTLHHLSHVAPDDLDILLVGPTGAKSIIMSDVGGANGVNDISLTFSSLASQSLPDTSLLVSGAYRPTDFQIGDVFANSTAPVGPYVADLSAFYGTNPNGIWSLYVQDDSPAASPLHNGYLASGWSLSLTTGPSIFLAVSPASVSEDGAANLTYTFTRTGSTA
ncbi:MAG: S8 family serine peptidase, partial [Cyanobium sp.]